MNPWQVPGDVLPGLGPILIQVGSEEVLLDDSRRYAVKARKAGAQVTLEVCRACTTYFRSNLNDSGQKSTR